MTTIYVISENPYESTVLGVVSSPEKAEEFMDWYAANNEMVSRDELFSEPFVLDEIYSCMGQLQLRLPGRRRNNIPCA